MTHEEPGLFDLPEAPPASRVIEDPPITPEQIASIRNAFDSAGIAEMAERQEVIQSCVIRKISNIRELYSREVRQVLARIERWGCQSEAVSGSAWDNREEDTWIDKL
jgi:hypothetical protein